MLPELPDASALQGWVNLLTLIATAVVIVLQRNASKDRAIVKEKLDEVTQVTHEKLQKIETLVDGPFGSLLERFAAISEEKAAFTDSKANGDAAMIARAESDKHNAEKAEADREAEAKKQDLVNTAKTTDPIYDSRNSDEPKQT